MKKEPLYGVGDLVVFNETGEFGNEDDCLFHIHDVVYEKCKNGQKEFRYAGYLLNIRENNSKGLPQVPVFRTTILGVSENQMWPLEHLSITFRPYSE